MEQDTLRGYRSEKRLQRMASDKQSLVATFTQVFIRHGLTMGTIAGICIFLPVASATYRSNFTPLMSSPFYYLAVLSLMSLGFILLLLMRGHAIKPHLLAWLAYLFFISVVEEFSFRLILPAFLGGTIGMIPAVLFSNFLFACVHYVTLRWKFINCAVVFIAGLGLSRLLTNTEDIAIVTLTHFFFTFINTPTPPKRRE